MEASMERRYLDPADIRKEGPRLPRRAYTGSHAPEAPDPLTCCGQGCPDCVWIVYGMQLLHYYSDKPIDESLRLLDEQIPNVGLREYVKGELRAKIKRRKSS
uniref:Oxidoreductase-like domain-containing protein n=1 Tax=Ascaris lumbricoides TaxID=6252 RepID=A0A0M3HMM5_ASCLU